MRKTDLFALPDCKLFSLLFAYNVLHGIQWLAIIKNRICQQFFVTENSLPSNIHHGRNVINVSMEIGLFLIWSKDPQTIEHWLRSFSLFLFSLYAALNSFLKHRKPAKWFALLVSACVGIGWVIRYISYTRSLIVPPTTNHFFHDCKVERVFGR